MKSMLTRTATDRQPRPKMTQAPNFLVIQADQMAANALPAYGNAVTRTPNLDALGRSGTVFLNAHCPFPLCAPSRFAMMTGQLPSRIRAFDNAAEFPSEIPTFAHYLRARGYRSSLIGKMHFVGADQLHGFETRLTSDIYPGDFYWTENLETRTDKTKSDARGVTLSGVCKRSVQLDFDEMTMFRAEQHLYDLARAADDRPFLSVVSLTHPHEPFYCTRDYWDLYDDADIPLPNVAALPSDAQDPLTRYNMVRYELEGGFDEATIRRARRAYYGSVSYVDAQVGRLVRLLEQLELRDNTVIVFTSDHGEFLGERGLWYKRHFFQPSVAVPLLISAPDGPRDLRCDKNVSLVDLLPTLLDLAGDRDLGDLREPIDGRSLTPLMSGGDWENVAYSEIMSDGLPAPVFMIRRDAWKLIYGSRHPAQLFNLEDDPNEQRDLATTGDAREVLARLIAEADAKWDSAAIQADIDLSIARRLLVRQAHNVGRAPDWDYAPDSDETSRWCRRNSDYNAWAFDVL